MTRSILIFIIVLILMLKYSDSSNTTEPQKDKFITKLYESRYLGDLLNGIVNHLMLGKKVTCITLVCDTTFLNVFNGQWFRRTNSVPVIMVVVEEPEDLLSPNYDTLESLRQSRKESCKLYIILLANGIQASRFLTFGEKYRLIDTRANFVMFHDQRLFPAKLHYIWKRIINVLFIRYHYQTKRLNNGSEIISWYELSTVPFPSPVKDVMVPKRIQSWRTNTVFRPTSLIPDRTKDLKGRTINVVALQHAPGVVKVHPSDSNNKLFSGIEMQIINTFSSAMNFKVNVYEPSSSNVEKWGRKLLNGSFTGLLGEMVHGKADVALGNLHYTPYHLQLVDLTIPYITECLTFLTPEALRDNSWKTLILPFKLYMWVAVLLVLMVSGVIFYLLAQFHKKIADYRTNMGPNNESRQSSDQVEKRPQGLYLFEDFSNSVLYTYGMLLVISLPQLPPGWSMRFLTGWYWIYCVLVVTSYRASMTAVLANPAPRVTIDTLDQLADSIIICGGWGEQTKEFFKTSLDETGQRIGKKFETVNDPIKGAQRVANGDLAYYDNVYFLKYLKARQDLSKKQKMEDDLNRQGNNTNGEENDDGDNGDRNLHVMTECGIHMPISVGLQKNSPLKPRVDKLLRKIIEAGLIQKWLNDVMVPIYGAITSDEENIKAEMNLKKLYVGFVALGFGYGLGLLTFIGEIIHWKYVVLRDPKFDRFHKYHYFKNKK